MTRARRKAAGFKKRERELEKEHAVSEKKEPSEAALIALEKKRALKMKKQKDAKKNPASVQVDTLQCLDTTKANLFHLAKVVKVAPSDKRDILIRKLARSVCDRPNIQMDLVRKDFENGKKWWEQYSIEKAAICKRLGKRPDDVPDLCSLIVSGGAKVVAQALEALSIYALARRVGSTDIKKNKFEYIAKIMDSYCPDGPMDSAMSVTPAVPSESSGPEPADPSAVKEPSTTSAANPSMPENSFAEAAVMHSGAPSEPSAIPGDAGSTICT
jgi:hypothetical protein